MTATEEIIKNSSLEFLRKLYELSDGYVLNEIERKPIFEEIDVKIGGDLESEIMNYLIYEKSLVREVLGGDYVYITPSGIQIVKIL